ncbi:MAG: hypothetical protein RJA70_2478 [Pseudomonadota bacterium]|jgi:RNA polymerase sigma-70 factor (ECF subfamily)
MLAERFIRRAAENRPEHAPDHERGEGSAQGVSSSEDYSWHARAASDPGQLNSVEEMLRHIQRRVTLAWPEFSVSFDEFALYLAERVPQGQAIGSVEGLHLEDLFLAYGCVRGERSAVRAFEARYMAEVAQYLETSKDYRSHADEIRQRVLERALVGTTTAEPKLRRYAGTGPLAAWLRTMTVRVAVDLLRQGDKRHPPKNLPESMPAIDPEVLYLKGRYREESEAALRAAIATLDARSTNVLKYYYFESMSSEAIGRIYSVTPRTVQRWLSTSQEQVVREFRKQLSASLDLSATQLDSLVGLVQSQLGATVSRCFEAEL